MILQYCCTLRDVCPASTRAEARTCAPIPTLPAGDKLTRLAGLRASRAVKLALTVLAALSAAQAPSAPAAARSAQPEAVFLANEPAPSSPVSHAAKLVSTQGAERLLNCWDQKENRTDDVDARELQLRADVARDDACDDVLDPGRLVDAPASFR